MRSREHVHKRSDPHAPMLCLEALLSVREGVSRGGHEGRRSGDRVGRFVVLFARAPPRDGGRREGGAAGARYAVPRRRKRAPGPGLSSHRGGVGRGGLQYRLVRAGAVAVVGARGRDVCSSRRKDRPNGRRRAGISRRRAVA